MGLKKTVNPMVNQRTISDLPSFVKDNADLYEDLPVYSYNIKKESFTVSYREFYNNIVYLGTAFNKLGLTGSTIGVVGEANHAYMTTYHATVWGNGIIVPLDKEITEDEFVNFVELAGIRAIVYMPGQAEKIIPLFDRMTGVDYFISVSENAPFENEKVLSFSKLLELGKEIYESGNVSFTEIEQDVEKPCAIIFSSGTTGTSKGIMLCQRNLCAAAYSACEAMCFLETGFKLVSVLPMNHTYEVTCSHLASQFFGTNTFLNDSLKYVVKNLKAFQPDLLVLVPLFLQTMSKKIWDEINRKGMTKKVKLAQSVTGIAKHVGLDLSKVFFEQITATFGGNLKGIVSGAAPLSADIIKDFNSFGIDVLEGYGITECSPLVSVNRLGKSKFHSVGTPVKGCEVKIIKQDDADETGEIAVKGDNVMLGYFNNEEATNAVFTEDGWFLTGDIGYMDKNNYIYITGRKKNVIILSNGKNIFPEEIEEYLYKCKEICECVVVGKPNQLGETVITVIVYPDYDYLSGIDDDAVLEAIRESVSRVNKELPTYKQIHGIEIRKTEFDKTTTKKIKRYNIT